MEENRFTYLVDAKKIDNLTGEITDAEGVFHPLEQLKGYQKKKYKERTRDELGAFTWLLFNNAEELLPTVSPANITRLIYISTFLGYEGYLITANYRTMTKELLQKQLKLNRNLFKLFWNEMIDNNIFVEKEGKIYLNDSIFRKGKMDKKLDADFTRLCIKGIRYIYENCTDARQHKTMSYLFKAIPYVNKEWNIVSKNDINEKNIDLIEPMMVAEFGELIGYGNSNTNKLIKKLCSIKIDGEGAFTIVLNLNKAYMVINPKVYYAGRDWHNVQVINQLS